MEPYRSLQNSIVPSALQPPMPASLPTPSTSVCEAPPGTLIFLNFPSAKKPRYWLSGDQNGYAASSVPGNMAACCASSGRNHSFVTPFSSTAENASVFPSGETATGPTSKPPEARNAVPGGGGMYASTESDNASERCARK